MLSPLMYLDGYTGGDGGRVAGGITAMGRDEVKR
jgi:hypothetical protein